MAISAVGIFRLSDNELFERRAKVRELLAGMPEHAEERALVASLLDQLTQEVDRRIKAAREAGRL